MFDALCRLTHFNGYIDEQLAEIAPYAQEQEIPAHVILLKEGEPAEGLYILLGGAFEMLKQMRGQEIVLSRHELGDFAGKVALFTGLAQPATVWTTQPSRFILFDAGVFESFKNSPLAAVIVSIAQRLRTVESVVYQQDKLSALGKIAAGLAHELNNPAAAGLRAARLLPEYLTELQAQVFDLNGLRKRRSLSIWIGCNRRS